MNNTEVTNNLQHGVFIENIRNYAFVNASDLSSNMYGAGLKVFGGAGQFDPVRVASLDAHVLCRCR